MWLFAVLALVVVSLFAFGLVCKEQVDNFVTAADPAVIQDVSLFFGDLYAGPDDFQLFRFSVYYFALPFCE